ncbi:MAG: lysophospholipid acyltransferase family protein [Candidatus Pseudobacter hemicellulosilyticus]|uniref:Lysophospholipid acyltransferase family protein n=1 Tax=Candidatus Pseudobacter hemicellulosilyticus TaxID=3121375 RepID=A0AAJ5WQ92_9BACT|nr:MAG: lysophospholipid acyltransferase family protein [Pseudobacter sp.]
MKLIKEILGRILALWAALVFVGTMLVFLIPFILYSYTHPDPTRNIRFLQMARVWMSSFRTLIGCWLTIRGREHFKKGQQYIVVCNHNSLMDIPVSSPAIPHGNKTIAKMEMARIPLFGMIYRSGSVLVDRKNEKSRKDSFRKMIQALNMGLHMCIYPEGTRNKSELPIKAFHDGAFRLALDTGHAIIPGVIFNTKKVLPANKPFYFMPHRLAIHFLPPIAPEPGESTESLKNRVHALMLEYYVANDRP